jgi:hypothetical protein
MRRTRRADAKLSKRDEMDKIVFARIGAVFYVLWGLLHYNAAYNVYRIGLAVSPGMAQARLFQDAFYIFAFATTGIVLAIKMNWHNSPIGYWLNALIISVADVPFILFVLIPDYAPFRSGVLGVAALIFTGLGQTRPIRIVPHESSTGPEAWARPGTAAARILEELDEVVRKSHHPSALRRRATEGGSYRVRVSLARVVLWLLQMGIFDKSYASDAAGDPGDHAYPDPDLFEAETPCGHYQGVTDQVVMSGTPGFLAVPLVPRGSSKAEWLAR